MSVQFVTIHPFDPRGGKIGGIETAIRSMLQHAPSGYELYLVGVTENPIERPVGEWQDIEYCGRTVRFYPVFAVPEPNRRTFIPLFLRFALSLRNHPFHFENAVTVYHRIEPLSLTAIPSNTNVLCIHGDPREITGPQSEVRWKYIPWLYRKAEANAVQKSCHLFVVSREGTDYFQTHYPNQASQVSFLSTYYRDDIFFIQDTVQMNLARNIIIEKTHGDEKSQFVLFAGRFEEQKNPILALETFALLPAREPDVHLLLAGSGRLKSKMKSWIQQRQLTSRIHWLGTLSALELADVMQACRVFLMTSHFEGMPIGALEALACGLPIVTTDAGEMRSIVCEDRTGHIVSESNPPALADALLDIIKHPEKFPKEACARSVHSLRPAAVLTGFFDTIQTLAARMQEK